MSKARPIELVASALTCTAVGARLLLAPASASAATVSANWAGYVATPTRSVGSRFSSVSGSWTQPSATCSAGRETYSAVWVGLGGDSDSERALEQIGADANCTRSGDADYSSWYELVPAGPVKLTLKVHAGDRMSAAVTVAGHGVTLGIRDLSTGAHLTKTRRIANVDVSSAEWIVEAPSVCLTTSTCATLPLTNFGTLVFSGATATAHRHTGTIEDPDWSTTALELQQAAGTSVRGPAASRDLSPSTLPVATVSPVASSSGSFSVIWQEQQVQVEPASAPTLPGFNGGPP
jgi:hypothetical protein